ncbi:uncharacterized protein LOC141755963 [Sebastes fasciatus]|uniref:uncharacterized protein LOC141755963 n=1 Tax=Sebastes fasciatus TaxID=394691 RepID=UPI003D9EFEC9
MATQDGEDVQRAEKIVLKRKLTGPPRLLLGKTRTRSEGEDRPEARTNKMENSGGDESSPKHSAELTETANTDGVNVENARGCCEAAEEDDDITNRRRNRCKWWRRFSPAVVCNRKQKKDVDKGSAKQQSGVPVPPEGALQETDTEGKRRFNVRTWPTFKRFLTSSSAQRTHKHRRDGDGEHSLTFRKKVHSFFTKGQKSRSSGVALENIEDEMKSEEAPWSSVAQVDEPTDVHSDGTAGGPEVVTVTVEERAAESPDGTQVSVTEEDVTDAGGSETIQTDTNKVPDPPEVFIDQLSQSLQPSTNGPSIRIELFPPDDDEDEEEEECFSSENQNHHPHLLLLVGFDHSERQLAQTARSLVRAAMNAAVDQLTREQLSDADCVHREPPGCRDHA